MSVMAKLMILLGKEELGDSVSAKLIKNPSIKDKFACLPLSFVLILYRTASSFTWNRCCCFQDTDTLETDVPSGFGAGSRNLQRFYLNMLTQVRTSNE